MAFTNIGSKAVMKSQEFTTSGTWVCPTGVTTVNILAVGGGSNGQKGQTDSNNSGYGGGAGAIIYIENVPVTGNLSIIIGSAQGNTTVGNYTAKGCIGQTGVGSYAQPSIDNKISSINAQSFSGNGGDGQVSSVNSVKSNGGDSVYGGIGGASANGAGGGAGGYSNIPLIPFNHPMETGYGGSGYGAGGGGGREVGASLGQPGAPGYAKISWLE